MYRNPSPPPGLPPTDQTATTIIPLVLKLVQGIEANSVDAGGADGSDLTEDTVYERTLCAVWDLASVEEHAAAMMGCGVHRMILKVITTTTRTRTRELAMGVLANLSYYWDAGIGPTLLDDEDVTNVVGAVLTNEADARTLVEASRFLKTSLTHLLSPAHTPNSHSNVTSLLLRHALFQHYSFIVSNTLNSELLLESLRTLYWILVYLYANDLTDGNIQLGDALFLLRWGVERLEEEGTGLEFGINREVTRVVMDLMLAVFRSGCVKREECGDIADSLGRSVRRIMSHIEDDDDDGEGEMRRLAAALTDGSSCTMGEVRCTNIDGGSGMSFQP